MSIPFTGLSRPDRFNYPLYGLRGAYTLSDGVGSIPYFLCALPILRLIGELKTAEQIPPSLNNEWNLEELFQREVDRARITKEMVRNFLADPKKLKFFNAITVVLMPKDPNRPILLDNFGSYAHKYPPIPSSPDNVEDSAWQRPESEKHEWGGVQYVTIGDHARLRWDSESVYPVVVDGQHRLVALQEYHDVTHRKALPQRAQETKIPVIFLLLAREAGFDPANRKSIRQLAREVFTDLNKNAKKVDRARELILDDYSLTARCTRTLITTDAARDSNTELPLALVRWKDDKNRFDTHYYISSLTHLELLVDTVLPTSEPSNSMDAPSIRSFIQAISERLGGDLTVEGVTLQQAYERDYCDANGEPEAPFSRLPTPYLDAAIEAFKEHHKPWLVRVLTGLKPYRDLLDYARKNNLIEGHFGHFMAQTDSHKTVLKQQENDRDPEWYQKTIQKHIDHIEDMKGAGDNADWTFKAIFQKALVRLALDVGFTFKHMDSMGGLESLINLIDSLHAKGVLRVGAPLAGDRFTLWNFIATNPGGGQIKVAKGTEDRILAVLRLWHYSNQASRNDGKYKDKSPRQILDLFFAETQTHNWPHCKDMADTLYKAHKIKTFLAEEDLEERIQQDRIRSRLASILKVGLL